MVKFKEIATKQVLNATSQSTIEEFRKRKDLYEEILESEESKPKESEESKNSTNKGK